MHNPESRLKKTVILILYLLASIPVSGSDNNIDRASRNCYGYRIYTGNLDNRTADVQQGIYDYLPKLLDKFSITESEYISITTTTVSDLSEADRSILKQLRESLPKPSSSILLQKVISLDDITTYVDNKYGGTIGGFVSIAGDVKSLRNMYQIY